MSASGTRLSGADVSDGDVLPRGPPPVATDVGAVFALIRVTGRPVVVVVDGVVGFTGVGASAAGSACAGIRRW